MIRFSKYSGCGNDFILIDHREPFFPINNSVLMQKLCHRQKGIGADGVIFLEKSFTADFRMRIFNLDGSEAEMCGNGLRCLAQFIYDLGLPKKPYTIQTMERQLTIEALQNGIRTSMGTPKGLQLDILLPIGADVFEAHYVDTGVPHTVVLMDKLDLIDVSDLGKNIRFHPHFAPKGSNANFVKKVTEQTLSIRTYERGVEAETLACGTGACAAAIVAAYKWGIKSPVAIETRSGDILTIEFTKTADGVSNITQTGSAVKNFHGEFVLPQGKL